MQSFAVGTINSAPQGCQRERGRPRRGHAVPLWQWPPLSLEAATASSVTNAADPGDGWRPRCGRSVEVLDDLVRARPLTGRNGEPDLAVTVGVERMVGDAGRLDSEVSKLVSPGHGGVAVAELGDRLPVLEARVRDRHRVLATAPEHR